MKRRMINQIKNWVLRKTIRRIRSNLKALKKNQFRVRWVQSQRDCKNQLKCTRNIRNTTSRAKELRSRKRRKGRKNNLNNRLNLRWCCRVRFLNPRKNNQKSVLKIWKMSIMKSRISNLRRNKRECLVFIWLIMIGRHLLKLSNKLN